MPSPFPGMNPHLEQDDVWHDFHQAFITTARELIAAQVRPAYIVRLDRNVYIHEHLSEDRDLVGRGDRSEARQSDLPFGGVGNAVFDAPAICRTPPVLDLEREDFLQILDRETREVVTILELLSPTNKSAGPNRQQYLAKRRQILASPTHLVEVDLLRGGPRMPAEDLPPCDYCVLVSRAERRPEAGVWPIRLRDRLPEIPIPLRALHPEARLDLQAALHRVYDAAGYDYQIYDGPPQPPLSPEDAAWAASLIPRTA